MQGGLSERALRVVLDTGESRRTLRANGYSGCSDSTTNASKLTRQWVPSPEEADPREKGPVSPILILFGTSVLRRPLRQLRGLQWSPTGTLHPWTEQETGGG